MNKLAKKDGILLLLSVTLMVFTLACINLGTISKKTINNLKELKDDEVIIIGKITMEPKIGFSEYHRGLSDKYRFTAYIRTYKERPPKNKVLHNMLDDNVHYFSVALEKTFFLKSDKSSFYIVGVTVPTGKDVLGLQYPARFKVQIKKSDKAVYIGRLHYQEDEFGSFVGMKLIDEFDKARKDFKKKFGRSVKIRKALVKPVL